jgi:hypothetical protein
MKAVFTSSAGIFSMLLDDNRLRVAFMAQL